MKTRRFLKLALACLLIVLPLILSGCVVTPDIQTNNPQNGDLNFPQYPVNTEVPTRRPTNQPTSQVYFPTDAPVNIPTPNNQGSWIYTIAPLPTSDLQQNTTTIVTPPPSAAPSATPVTSLKLGSTGEEVRSVQRKLKDLGFYKGSVDGDFGEGTEAAVKAFQKQYGLTVDGKVGRDTMAKLTGARATARPTASPTPRPTATPAYNSNTYLRKGDSGRQVSQMQDRLINLGYLSGVADGDFDVSTEAAVISFQKRNCSYSDGIAGPDTLKALYGSPRSTSSSAGIVGVTLKIGSEGGAVRTLQTRLKSLGYYKGVVDGQMGTGTVDALKAFQKAHGLTADGVAGGGTFDRLFASNAKTASATSSTPTPRPIPTRKPTATPRVTPSPLPENTYVQVTTAPGYGNYATLRRGYYGEPVRKMQEKLKQLGDYTGVADGYFGEGTENAVKAFQRVKGLNIDGVAGPATLRNLFDGDYPYGA